MKTEMKWKEKKKEVTAEEEVARQDSEVETEDDLDEVTEVDLLVEIDEKEVSEVRENHSEIDQRENS